MTFGRGSDGAIVDNVIVGNGVGVSLDHGGTSYLAHNVIAGNQTGVGVGSNLGLRAVDNVIALNAGRGVSLVLDQRRAVGQRDFVRNGGPGVYGEDADVTIDENRIQRNGAAGIELTRAGPYVVTGNRVDRNAAHGIDLAAADPGALVSGNHAWFNGALGIEAVPGTDGSANWAKHNGDRRQCVNVSCSTRGKPKRL